jgi:hypothetical protein
LVVNDALALAAADADAYSAPTGMGGEMAATRLTDMGGTSPASDGIACNEPTSELSCAEQKQGMDGS